MEKLLKLFELYKAYSGFVTLGSFILWIFLRKYAKSFLSFFRKILSLLFLSGSFISYSYFSALITKILQTMGIEDLLRSCLLYYKGTDWFEGLIYGISITFTISINIVIIKIEFCTKEKPQKEIPPISFTQTANIDP